MEEQVRADVAAFAEAMAEPSDKGKHKTKAQKESAMPKFVPPAETLVPPPNLEDDIAARASIMRKIAAYEREFKDRLVELRTPKNLAKASLDDLKLYLADIEHELGKAGAYELVRHGFVQLCKQIESFQARSQVLPYDLKNFGEAGVIASSEFLLPDGSVQKGSMMPLLKEISIKYSDWFSQRVEVRFIVQLMGMMAEVHRINTDAPKTAAKASGKKASASASAAAKGV